MAQHAAGFQLPNATAGSEREAFLREFLRKIYPAHHRFSTGAITDSSGAISGQIDIAVEYGFGPSFAMPSTEERLFLAESIALAIEVKSNLSSQWEEVQASVKKVKRLNRQFETLMVFGSPPGPKIPYIAIGYTGHKTIDGLAKRLETTPPDERPDGALVIESGCFHSVDVQTNGPLGLYALCMAISSQLAQLAFAQPNLKAYVQARAAPP